MKLLSFKPLSKNTLVGVADIELEIGLQIIGIMLHVRQGTAWIALPGKPVLDGEGRHVIGENGKKSYVPFLSWRTIRLRNAFGAAVIDLVLAQHPDVLEAAL
jgi:hypothetical protein